MFLSGSSLGSSRQSISVRGRSSQNRMVVAQAKKLKIPNREGHKLASILEEPKGSEGTAPVAILTHGFGENKNEVHYPALAEELAKIGVASLRFDFAGNGDSEGPFRFFNYSDEVEDIRSVVAHLRSQGRDVVMLVGHSKSGNNVLLYASKYDGDVPLIVNLAGRFHMKDGITDSYGTDIFRKLELQRSISSYKGHKLTYEQLQERVNLDMYKVVTSIKKSRVLTVHGTDDMVIPVRDAHVIDKLMAPTKNHRLELIQGADHNHERDHEKEAMIDSIISFLKDVGAELQLSAAGKKETYEKE